MAKRIKGGIFIMNLKNKRSRLSLSLIFMMLTSVLFVDLAWAHGERNQEPFLRMRTLHWYDVEFSKPADSVIKVNEDLTI